MPMGNGIHPSPWRELHRTIPRRRHNDISGANSRTPEKPVKPWNSGKKEGRL
jgi:hypothetical protein|tara:strand:+ start:1151 stop:1306 length:156 start_codon:yes stop_codon:yes gene_type:complete